MRPDANSLDAWTRGQVVVVLLALLLFVALVAFAAQGVRGSDQYGYVGDVESLIEGRGVATNNIFPVSARQGPPTLPRPFMHNIISLYLTAPIAKVLGAYAGCIVFNVLCSLLASVLIFIAVSGRAGRRPALLAALAYLFMPLTFWLTTQPLAGPSIAMFVALAVVIYASAGSVYWRWALLTAVGGMLLLSRPNFILLLPLIPLVFLLHSRPVRWKSLAQAAGLGVLALIFLGLKLTCFKSNIEGSDSQSASRLETLRARLVLVGVPGVTTNMNHYFNLKPPAISTWEALRLKSFHNLKLQLIPSGLTEQVFCLPFNLAVLLLLCASRRTDYKDPLVAAAIAFLLVYLITITGFVSQSRYSMMAAPAILAALGILIGRWKWLHEPRPWTAALVALLVLTTALNLGVARYSRAEAAADHTTRQQLHRLFDQLIPPHDTIMIQEESGTRRGLLGYVLRPRYVLFVESDYTTQDYQALRRNVRAKWLISRLDCPILDHLKTTREIPIRLPQPMNELAIFKLAG